jgi:hypothetical protein
MKSIRLSPRYWWLATLLIPIAGAVSYGVWLVVSAANLASSTQSEELVRSGVLAILTMVFFLVPRPGTRAIAVAAAVALVLSLAGAVQFEVFRGR